MSDVKSPDALEACRAEVAALRNLAGQTRSPALFGNSEALRVSRFLAHPVCSNVAAIALGSVKADDRPDRVAVARRLITAYKKALADEPRSPLRRQGEDIWTRILREELPPLLKHVEAENAESLAAYLLEFGASFVWFGGVTTAVDAFGLTRNPPLVALLYYDKLVSLAESLGILRHENPEQGPWGVNLKSDVATLIRQIEAEIGIGVLPPMGAVHTDGLVIPGGVLHYRHLTSLYAALQLPRAGAVCEYGGGLGICAMYARKLGLTDYTIYDLPISNLLSAHYLIHAIGAENVRLYGEEPRDNAVKILPYWDCLNAPDKRYATAFNQDSIPEIDDSLIEAFLREIRRTTQNVFVSQNHEAFHPRTVSQFTRRAGGYERLTRAKSWLREGYVDEVFRIVD
jgi:hypothetical protein